MTQTDQAPPITRTAEFMFLGGELDHHRYHLAIDEHGMPLAERWNTQALHWVDLPEPKIYRRHRVVSGSAVWYVYILDGHSPSRGDVVDARPYL